MMDEEIKKIVKDQFYISDMPATFEVINGEVSVDGNCSWMSSYKATKLPIKFSKVTGSFFVNDQKIVTLVGSPETVGKTFGCSHNLITSLVGGPIEVGKNYYCDSNPHLVSLDGCPNTVGERFYCDWNENLPLLKLVRYTGVTIYYNDEVNDILYKYVGKKPLRQAIIQCQRELIDNGFEGNAKL